MSQHQDSPHMRNSQSAHHLELITDALTPYYRCSVCGKTFASSERLADVQASVCSGVMGDYGFYTTSDHAPDMRGDDSSTTTFFFSRSAPESTQVIKGSALLDAWLNEEADK